MEISKQVLDEEREKIANMVFSPKPPTAERTRAKKMAGQAVSEGSAVTIADVLLTAWDSLFIGNVFSGHLLFLIITGLGWYIFERCLTSAVFTVALTVSLLTCYGWEGMFQTLHVVCDVSHCEFGIYCR